MDVHSQTGQRCAIFTLWSSGSKAAEIHRQLCTAHGDHAVSKMTVNRWVNEFKAGRTDVSDLPRSGRPAIRDSSSLMDRILDLIDEDCRQSVREMADRLDCPKSTVYECLQKMNHVKLSARWVPRLLTEDMKLDRKQTCLNNLKLVEQHGGWETFRELVVTGDETWVPYFDPPTKQESMVWTVKGSDPPTKARREKHSKKVMLTFFFDCDGPLSVEFLEPNSTINADRYVASLTKLKSAIRNKRRGKERPHILHHDNARPHTAAKTMEAIDQLNFELLPHPPYSPDLAPADFALFPELKRQLRGRVHDSRDHLESEVKRVLLYQIPRSLYANAIDKMRARWEKCVMSGGDYVEKASLPNDDE